MPAALPPDDAPLPRHIAVIMDGNGRWAKARGRPRVFGHRAGVEAVRRTVRTCGEWGIEALSLYAFSTENWSRPADEVGQLMKVLGRFVRRETPSLEKSNVRLRFIGDLSRLDAPLRKAVDAACERLAPRTGLKLNIAVNYGGRDELVRAARALARDVRAGALDPDRIDAETVEARLDTAGLPPVDLMVRTAGEMRVSNFLLWQAAYAEFWATPKCWPEFGADLLAEAVAAYRGRVRKFGGLAASES